MVFLIGSFFSTTHLRENALSKQSSENDYIKTKQVSVTAHMHLFLHFIAPWPDLLGFFKFDGAVAPGLVGNSKRFPIRQRNSVVPACSIAEVQRNFDLRRSS